MVSRFGMGQVVDLVILAEPVFVKPAVGVIEYHGLGVAIFKVRIA